MAAISNAGNARPKPMYGRRRDRCSPGWMAMATPLEVTVGGEVEGALRAHARCAATPALRSDPFGV